MSARSKRIRVRRAEVKRAAEEIGEIMLSLQAAYMRFNQTTDPELMDAYIYEINALRARYDHAFRRAKSKLM